MSHLSPYVTQRPVSLPQVVAGVAAHHPLTLRDKFVFGLCWRAALPDDVRQGRTGVPVIEQAVRHLYAKDYLQNCARMWLHLSWQWVAGIGSSTPHLFTADNVEKSAPPVWHSRGSVIDISYEAMEKLALSAQALNASANFHAGAEERALWNRPPSGESWDVPDPALVKGHDVWLLHPRALHDPPAEAPDGCLCVGVSISQFQQRWPWSAARWRFGGAAMAAVTEQRWHLDVDELACVLREARSVQTVADPHIDALLDSLTERLPAPQLFPEVTCPCRSFSQWWKRATQGIDSLSELPGMLGLEA